MRLLSGVFADEAGRQVTTGTPISPLIDNVDQRGRDYTDIKDKFRPGHADFTYWEKYGIRDYRGGGRSSARETAMRVAAGAIARKVLPAVTIRGALVQIGAHKIDRNRWSWDEVDNNPFFSPDPGIVETWSNYLDGRAQGRLLGRRRHRDRGRGCARRLGRAHLRQARPGPGCRHDEHQRGQGRGDRGRHGRSRALPARTNADEIRMGNDGKPFFTVQPRRRHPGRHLLGPADRVPASP